MQLVLQLTRDCNLGCRYCYQRHSKGASMPAAVAERAVQWLLDEGYARVAVTYFGGEPLLNRATLEATWPALRRSGLARGSLVSAKVCTNGVELERSFARFARESALFVSLSTDGGPQVQDSGRPFTNGAPSSAAVERALEALVAERTPFATYQVVTPQNCSALAASTRWLFERGSRLLVSSLAVDQDWRPADFERLQESYAELAQLYASWLAAGERFYLAPFDAKIDAHTRLSTLDPASCCAGVRQYGVDPEGWIYPCIEFFEDTRWRIGHVERGIEAGALKQLYAEHGGVTPAECRECGIRSRCASSCACLNLRTKGKLRDVDALLCAHERAVTLAADLVAAELFARRERRFLDRHYNPLHRPLEVLEDLFGETRTL
jgi:uncharacterized protein